MDFATLLHLSVNLSICRQFDMIILISCLTELGNMGESENSKATWFTAFKTLSRGKSPAIGKYPAWKSAILHSAIVAPFVLLYVQGGHILDYSGAIPPNVPVIRATGRFIQAKKGQASWIVFEADDGRVYNMERGTSIEGSSDMPQGNPPPKVYVEGFLRKNGNGYFWPTLIKMSNGLLLTDPQKSIDLLMRERRVGIRLLAIEILVSIFFGVFSIFNISIIRRRLISGSVECQQ